MSHQILSTLPPKSRLNPLTASHPHGFVSPLEHSGFAFELMKQPPNWSAKNGSPRPLISLSSPAPGLPPRCSRAWCTPAVPSAWSPLPA